MGFFQSIGNLNEDKTCKNTQHTQTHIDTQHRATKKWTAIKQFHSIIHFLVLERRNYQITCLEKGNNLISGKVYLVQEELILEQNLKYHCGTLGQFSGTDEQLQPPSNQMMTKGSSALLWQLLDKGTFDQFVQHQRRRSDSEREG